MTDITLQAPTDTRITGPLEDNAPPTNGKPTPDAWRTQLAGELADAEKELTRDQKALEAARAKVDALTADVRFDEMKVASRAKGVAEFDRLTAKAAK